MDSLADMVTELEGIEKKLARLCAAIQKATELESRARELRVALRKRLALGKTGGHAMHKGGQLDAVRQYLRERAPEPQECRVIASHLQQRPSHVSARCSHLVTTGEVRKVARGFYQWVTP